MSIKTFLKRVSDKLTALCNIDTNRFKGIFIKGNIDTGLNNFNFFKYNKYTDINKTFDKRI